MGEAAKRGSKKERIEKALKPQFFGVLLRNGFFGVELTTDNSLRRRKALKFFLICESEETVSLEGEDLRNFLKVKMALKGYSLAEPKRAEDFFFTFTGVPQ